MKASLLWVDLEMTGLSPAQDKIIEVGAIATDWQFREVARYSAVVKISPRATERWLKDEFWLSRKASRDKLRAEIAANGKTSRKIESELLKFLDDNFDLEKPIYLAGNSIHQDQKFIEREWPQLNSRLHYRQLDVSAWKVVFENRGIRFAKPELHRAMSDIEGSMAELKFYLEKVNFAKK